jgi:hypothetical protein
MVAKAALIPMSERSDSCIKVSPQSPDTDSTGKHGRIRAGGRDHPKFSAGCRAGVRR